MFGMDACSHKVKERRKEEARSRGYVEGVKGGRRLYIRYNKCINNIFLSFATRLFLQTEDIKYYFVLGKHIGYYVHVGHRQSSWHQRWRNVCVCIILLLLLFVRSREQPDVK